MLKHYVDLEIKSEMLIFFPPLGMSDVDEAAALLQESGLLTRQLRGVGALTPVMWSGASHPKLTFKCTFSKNISQMFLCGILRLEDRFMILPCLLIYPHMHTDKQES